MPATLARVRRTATPTDTEFRLLVLAALQLNDGAALPVADIEDWLEWCLDKGHREAVRRVLAGLDLPERQCWGGATQWIMRPTCYLTLTRRKAYREARKGVIGQ